VQRLIVYNPLDKGADRQLLEYDPSGDIGRTGNVNEEVLAKYLDYEYYQQESLPIGVGPDDFPEVLFEKWVKIATEIMGVSDADYENRGQVTTADQSCAQWKLDLLATFVELTTRQIALACRKWAGERVMGRGGANGDGAPAELILRGGVYHNSLFIERLAWNCSEQLKVEGQGDAAPLYTAQDVKSLADLSPPLDEESWENAMYAMFGYLCINNVYNFVPSCTGGKQLVVGGKIAPGANFGKLMARR
jgi:1,6-anhydro-N-acetylmuramate kinase